MAHESLCKYQKIFIYMLDIVCLSAHILYRKKGGKMSRLDFQLTLAENLSALEGHQNHQRRGSHQKPKAHQTYGMLLYRLCSRNIEKISQEDGLSAGHRGRGREAPTGAPTAGRLFVSHHDSGSTTQSQICPICDNKEGLGVLRNFKFTEKAFSVVSV
jgi:hypothetical protein